MKQTSLSPVAALILAVFGCAVLGWTSPAQAGPSDFLIIQPGQPGSPAEAQPVMDRLAAYLSKKTGETVTGKYFNLLEEGLAAVPAEKPGWGIVGLGFYAQYGKKFGLTPLASTRPSGRAKDVWRLVVPTNGPDDWRTLTGEVRGMGLFEKKAAPCLLFRGVTPVPASQPFTLEGTGNPLKSLRDAAKGKIAGSVLDQVQYDALASLPQAGELKTIHTSAELPTSPVVAFGPAGPAQSKIGQALTAMKADPEAAELLTLLLTDGFGPPDADLAKLLLENENAACPR